MCLFPRIEKNFNDLYYFQKVKNIQRKMKNVYILTKVEKLTSFPYFYINLILFSKVKNILPIHFFSAKYKKCD